MRTEERLESAPAPRASLPRILLPSSFGAATFAALSCFTAPSAPAALWESSRWAVTASTEAGIGYDNNLFSRAGSEGDGYFMFRPVASLQRLNSLTDFNTSFAVRSYSFFDNHDLNSADPELTLKLRYPNDDAQILTRELEAKIHRRTESNLDVGGRLRLFGAGARWEDTIPATGKITITRRAEFGLTEYENDQYSDNQLFTAGVTAGFVQNDRLQLGAAYDFEYTRTEPELNPQNTYGRRHLFTLRGRGEFLPKVTGFAFAGVSRNEYEGQINRSEWDFIASAALAWQMTERRTLTGRANRTSYFSASGSVTTLSELRLELSQMIAGGFTASAAIYGGTIKYFETTGTRTTDRLGADAEFRYALTRRFSAVIKGTFVTNDSSSAFSDFDQGTVYAETEFKF